MKIYTKKGDLGMTSLIGGTRVSKSHERIEVYGSVDELNSYIGLVRFAGVDEKDGKLLGQIQETLFTTGSHLASDPEKKGMSLPEIKTDDIRLLETTMDEINDVIPELRSFILPGGNLVISYCHIARCLCRRVERQVVKLSEREPVDPLIIQYLNRLSDYLFVLARKLAYNNNIPEFPWQPKT